MTLTRVVWLRIVDQYRGLPAPACQRAAAYIEAQLAAAPARVSKVAISTFPMCGVATYQGQKTAADLEP